MNKVILMGRLTRDPEVRYAQNGNQMAIARFSIAVDRRFKREGEPDADFFNCTAFGKQAEFVERYLHKGTKILTCGRIQNDNYTNKDGQMVYSVRVMVDEIEFAESKNAAGGAEGGFGGNGGFSGNNGFGGNSGFGGGNNYGVNSYNNPAPSGAGDGFMNIPDGIDEELPFN